MAGTLGTHEGAADNASGDAHVGGDGHPPTNRNTNSGGIISSIPSDKSNKQSLKKGKSPKNGEPDPAPQPGSIRKNRQGPNKNGEILPSPLVLENIERDQHAPSLPAPVPEQSPNKVAPSMGVSRMRENMQSSNKGGEHARSVLAPAPGISRMREHAKTLPAPPVPEQSPNKVAPSMGVSRMRVQSPNNGGEHARSVLTPAPGISRMREHAPSLPAPPEQSPNNGGEHARSALAPAPGISRMREHPVSAKQASNSTSVAGQGPSMTSGNK